MADRIQMRRDKAANWTTNNPTLSVGEFGIESDTLKIKLGDGVTAWNSLTYIHAGSSDNATVASTATTQSSSDNSTKIATTAFVHALMDYMTPIGYMFEWSPVSGKSIDLSTAQKVHDYDGVS